MKLAIRIGDCDWGLLIGDWYRGLVIRRLRDWNRDWGWEFVLVIGDWGWQLGSGLDIGIED